MTVTLNAPNGHLIADVTNEVDKLVTWMNTLPQKPKWRFSCGRFDGALTLKNDEDVPKVREFFYKDYESDVFMT